MNTVLQVCDGLVEESATDETALSLTSMALQALERLSDVTKIHAAAAKLNPDNIELLKGLFGAYVR